MQFLIFYDNINVINSWRIIHSVIWFCTVGNGIESMQEYGAPGWWFWEHTADVRKESNMGNPVYRYGGGSISLMVRNSSVSLVWRVLYLYQNAWDWIKKIYIISPHTIILFRLVRSPDQLMSSISPLIGILRAHLTI